MHVKIQLVVNIFVVADAPIVGETLKSIPKTVKVKKEKQLKREK